MSIITEKKISQTKTVQKDFDEDAPVWKKTWNRLIQPKKAQLKRPTTPQNSALLLIEQSNEVFLKDLVVVKII